MNNGIRISDKLKADLSKAAELSREIDKVNLPQVSIFSKNGNDAILKSKLKDSLKSDKRKLNQEFIAKSVGISQGQLSNIFYNRRKVKPELLAKINRVINSQLNRKEQ